MMTPLLPLCLFVVIAAHQSFAVKITSSGIQRTICGKNCTFRWTVDEPITNYTIYNQTTAYRTALDGYSYHEHDKASGVITLVLLNVQMWDAGNYTLELKVGYTIITDSTACLFVYDNLRGSVKITLGSSSAREGDAVELTCNLTSVSLPVPYRRYIYYAWHIPNYGRLRNISSGPAVRSNGELIPGYAVKNNGRTLRIISVRYPDDANYFYCYGLEDGSSLEWTKFSVYLSLRYRPYAGHFNPESKKFNVAIGKQVALSFRFQYSRSFTAATNWTFTDTTGSLRALPPGEYSQSHDYDYSYSYSYTYYTYILKFNMASSAYYGNYSTAMTNVYGSTTVIFQVLPEGRPDQPSNVRLYYASHSSIAVQCNRRWSNSLPPEQTVFFRLKLTESDVGVDLSSISYTREANNETITAYFTKNIKSETNYTVRVWSLNNLGSSDAVELKVRTRRQPKLKVSPDAIKINGTQAVIDFTFEEGNDVEPIARVDAQCCSVFSGQCGKYSGRYSGNQVVVDDIPDGTAYYIDLTVYGGIYDKYTYFSDSVRGLRASRNRNEVDYGEDSVSYPKETVIIVLAILLGITFLCLIVVCALYCLAKRNRSSSSHYSPPMLPTDDFINNVEMQRVKKGQNRIEVTPEDDGYYANAEELGDQRTDYREIQTQRRVRN